MPAPVIVLPKQFNGLSLATLAAEVTKHARSGWPPELVFDFSELTFIRPAGVVFLSNLVHWLNEKKTRVLFRNTKKQAAPLFLPGRLTLLSTAPRFKDTTNGFAAADYVTIAASSAKGQPRMASIQLVALACVAFIDQRSIALFS
jgi:hypothetical protein